MQHALTARGPLSIAELAKGVETTSAAATQLVNGLVNVGYVDREPDVGNRRAVRVSLTAKGRDRHRERILADALAEPLTHLSTGDLAIAADVLDRLSGIYDEL
ncbi:MarR family winged helix-turn-helix transcriptional regulator [Streptomyces aureocirculatus]|uniref:MarR family winged helix-turn-helix transcriptional regulator n=1 Tax=Streptomyces aureocirculatus TaxID=67275 RepID=UPI0013316489|nr:MarR family transcriptional regulator [Streptomyces aureocirculatus]